jgi:hypothetical protein
MKNLDILISAGFTKREAEKALQRGTEVVTEDQIAAYIADFNSNLDQEDWITLDAINSGKYADIYRIKYQENEYYYIFEVN